LFILKTIIERGIKLARSFLAAIVFYTTVPLPQKWVLEFGRIARWIPFIGVIIGIFLGLIDLGLSQIGLPILTRSVLLVGIWIIITGGLHLDGAIDTADGLATQNPKRRLEVMKDSVTGAYGAIAAAIILLLKSSALSEIESYRWLGLIYSAGWARWGQVVAIAFYPYLRSTGKGQFHKQNFHFPEDFLLGSIFLLTLSGVEIYWKPDRWLVVILITISGVVTAIAINWWLNKKLGGHTGDTYGAVVEWTEAILLCLFAIFFNF